MGEPCGPRLGGGIMDAVFWGSIISVAICVVIIVYLGAKVLKLMKTTHSED